MLTGTGWSQGVATSNSMYFVMTCGSVTPVRKVDELIASGRRDFLTFWGHRPRKAAEFTLDGIGRERIDGTRGE
jgi:hypothetical protein